jgi:hypothetical protein
MKQEEVDNNYERLRWKGEIKLRRKKRWERIESWNKYETENRESKNKHQNVVKGMDN